jgi:hypothetical protein
VRTFQRTLELLVTVRQGRQSLLLSELGGYLLPPQQAPAGTKRLSNLWRSPKWQASRISDFLQDQAHVRYQELLAAGKELYRLRSTRPRV